MSFHSGEVLCALLIFGNDVYKHYSQGELNSVKKYLNRDDTYYILQKGSTKIGFNNIRVYEGIKKEY